MRITYTHPPISILEKKRVSVCQAHFIMPYKTLKSNLCRKQNNMLQSTVTVASIVPYITIPATDAGHKRCMKAENFNKDLKMMRLSFSSFRCPAQDVRCTWVVPCLLCILKRDAICSLGQKVLTRSPAQLVSLFESHRMGRHNFFFIWWYRVYQRLYPKYNENEVSCY